MSTWGLHPQWGHGRKAPSESKWSRYSTYHFLLLFYSNGTLRLPQDSHILSSHFPT